LVQKKGSPQVGLFFILPNIKSVGLAKELPVDRTYFIASNIRTMLFEFDTGPFERGWVDAKMQSFHRRARVPLELRKAIAVLGT
jgi:hypothetical protein